MSIEEADDEVDCYSCNGLGEDPRTDTQCSNCKGRGYFKQGDDQ